MGRHSASYVSQQQAPGAGSTAVGAAAYVGRVGALALGLGIGAAVFGVPGLANADDGAADNAGDAPAHSTPDTAAAPSGPAAVGPSDTGSTDVKTPRPGLPRVPKMVLGGGSARLGQPPGGPETGDGDHESLSGLIARIPQQIASLVGGNPTAADPPTGVGSSPRAGSSGGTRPVLDSPRTRPSTVDAAIAPIVRATDEVAPSELRAPVGHLDVKPRAADTILPQRLSVAPNLVAIPAPTPTPTPSPSAPVRIRPVATIVSGLLAALGIDSSAHTGNAPVPPTSIVLGALQLLRREIEHTDLDRAFNGVPSAVLALTANQVENIALTFAGYTHPAPAPAVPGPGDQIHTPYADVGKWMLQPSGQIANYGGQPVLGKTILEPVNVIIIDRASTSKEESAAKLNAAMGNSGFPAQQVHSTGLQGFINGQLYGQQPTGDQEAFSDNLYFFPNDHGRVFGAAAAQDGPGYVWTGAFSTETIGIFNGQFTHSYVSYELARDVLALRMLLSGQATFGGFVPLDNAYNTPTTTTGDHDGKAIVLILK